jgi:hypothetical protein
MTKRRGIFMLLAATLLGTLATTAASIPAQASSPYHEIPNYVNRHCIDVRTEDNTFVQLWSCTGGSEQLFNDVLVNVGGTDYFEFVNARTGYCLGTDASFSVGLQAMSYPCGTDDSQYWSVSYANNTGSGWYQVLLNKYSGLCLDLAGNSSANGTHIQQYWCNGTNAQYWMIG